MTSLSLGWWRGCRPVMVNIQAEWKVREKSHTDPLQLSLGSSGPGLGLPGPNLTGFICIQLGTNHTQLPTLRSLGTHSGERAQRCRHRSNTQGRRVGRASSHPCGGRAR